MWERIVAALPDEATVIANQRLVDREFDHEADLIVLVPECGVAVLEVKGGYVRYDGEWHQGDHTIDPVGQAHRVRYALRGYVEADPRWSRGRIAWAHGVVAPYSDFAHDFTTPDCPRWMLHDREDLHDIVGRIERNIDEARRNARQPSVDDLDLVCEILRGRGFTEHDRNADAEGRRSEADRLTAEQAALLQVTRLLKRIEVRGGAGSGKTMLALAQAKELTRGRHEVPPQRVALLCYSIGLGQFLRREVESWPKGTRPAYTGTFHELGRRWGAPDGDRENSEFWEEELPGIMAELATDLPDGERYDAIIVDEAQDFADSWWVPLLRALKDPDRGGLYVYSDENQRIFARFGQPPVPLIPLVLDHNLRNTRQIHESFGPLAPTRMTSRGGDGVEVAFIPAGDDALGAADDAVEICSKRGGLQGTLHCSPRATGTTCRSSCASLVARSATGARTGMTTCSTDTCSGARGWSGPLWFCA